MRIGIIDYGVGNLGSVFRGLEELKVRPFLVGTAPDLSLADKIVLPGVGNFADCADLLRAGGWDDAIENAVVGRGKSLLGVCLGMQLLATSSSEGMREGILPRGLNLIPGHVTHLRELGCKARIPHVGWNEIHISKQGDPPGLLRGIGEGTDFYFVHSYAFIPRDLEDVLAETNYDVNFVAAVQRGNVWGTQFHPEKSSRAGLKLLKNFIDCDNA